MKTVDATFEVVKEKFTIIYEAVNCYEAIILTIGSLQMTIEAA